MSLSFTLSLLNAINSNTELKSRLKFVGDMAPDDVESPYLVIGSEQDTEGRLLNEEETRHHVILHTWSDYNGRKEVKEIHALLADVFANMEDMHLDDEKIMIDASEWWHGIMEYHTYLRR